jgi:hypothetical protein
MKIGIHQSVPPMPQHEDALFLIEGVLDPLYVEDEPERFLSRITQHPHDPIAHNDADALPATLIAQAADDIERALYFAEDVQYFACLIEGQVVCGEFAGAERLKPDHRVKAVVSRSGSVLYAHAILDPQQGYAWVHRPSGSAADAKAGRLFALWTFCFAYPCMATMVWLLGPGQWDALQLQLLVLLSCVVVCGSMALTGSWGMLAPGDSPTRIFGLLGFVDPQRVNLLQYQIWLVEMRKFRELIAANKKALRSGQMKPIGEPELMRESSDRMRHVHDYRQAIADGKVIVVR